MTLWALFSDVHGNWSALARALALAEERGAERYAALGDLVGRRAPDACVGWARESASLTVVGNRDLDHLALLDPAHQAWVRALPRRAASVDFLASHGDSSLDRELCSADLRRGFGRAYTALQAADRRVWFFGHTHHARVWRKPAATAAPELQPAVRVQLDLSDPAVCWIVNVGTVGMPRGGRGPASFALWCTTTGWLEHVAL